MNRNVILEACSTLIIFIVTVTCSSQPQNAKLKYGNAYLDTLFSKEILEHHDESAVRQLLKNSIQVNDQRRDSALIAFSEHPDNDHPSLALWALVQVCSPLLGPWVKANKEILAQADWYELTDPLELRREHSCFDADMFDTFLWALASSKHAEFHGTILSAFESSANLTYVEKLGKKYDADPSQKWARSMVVAQCRFKTPETDRRIEHALKSIEIPVDLEIIIRNGIARFGRYDFLPQIRAIRKRSFPSESDTEDLHEECDYAIKKLEQQQAKAAKIGLPLDWPESGE